jgi:hypothetical protein
MAAGESVNVAAIINVAGNPKTTVSHNKTVWSPFY